MSEEDRVYTIYNSLGLLTLRLYDFLTKFLQFGGNFQFKRSSGDFPLSTVAQWMGVCLPVQGTRIRSPVREDATCSRAAEPECRAHWQPACPRAPSGERPRALLKPAQRGLELCKTVRLVTTATESSLHSPQPENAHAKP